MRNYLSFLLALVAFSATAQTNLLVGQVGNYGLSPQSGIVCTLTLISLNPRVVDGIFVRREPVVATSLSNGAFYFTNILWGRYTLSIAGRVDTVFPINVGTNTLGTVQLGSLTPPSSAVPPNPATNYYTVAQIDSLLAALPTRENVLPWVGPDNGETYHMGVQLVDGYPIIVMIPGTGPSSTVLPWVGPSDGNNYRLVVLMVDGSPMLNLQIL